MFNLARPRLIEDTTGHPQEAYQAVCIFEIPL